MLAITPPFAGGPITSPVGPRDPGTHYGIDAGIDNLTIVDNKSILSFALYII